MTFGDPDAVINGSFTLDKKREHGVLYLNLLETVLSSAFLSCPGGILVSAPEQYSCV